MSLWELFQTISPEQAETVRAIFAAVRAGDKETWWDIVDNMTEPERELLIAVCDAGIREHRTAKAKPQA